ncbi:hypothetical protein CCMA1212_005732 [Trichoderma ghanense]|uniref:SSCRP protein n=1 Tax=Trichoderma ghanense TaxID=65468 RepID=A0ABY2H352_9HYPO
MAIDAEDVALLFALFLRFLLWLLHVFFATGYIILCKWLQHIRNHEFDQQHRIIDRRYCLVAIIFYSLATAVHLGCVLRMVCDAICCYRKQSGSHGPRDKTLFEEPHLWYIGITMNVIPHIVLLFPYIRWLQGFEANGKGSNAAYTIACIAVSALNISAAALAYLGLVFVMGLLVWSGVESRRESILPIQ